MMARAATSVVALSLLALAGCGSTDEPAEAPTKLDAAQVEQLVQSSDDLLSASSSFLADVIGCIRGAGDPGCVRDAFDAVRETLTSTAGTIGNLASGVEGNCNRRLTESADEVDPVLDALRRVADVARSGDFEKANAIAPKASAAAQQFSGAVEASARQCGA